MELFEAKFKALNEHLENKKNTKKDILFIAILNILFSLNVTGVILTKSRAMIFILGAFLIITIIKLKDCKIVALNIFIQATIALIFSAIFTNAINLYIMALFEILCSLALSVSFSIFSPKLKVEISGRRTLILILGVVAFYIILAFSIKTPLVVSWNEEGVEAKAINVYKLDAGKNVIKVKTSNLTQDANFDLKVYEVLSDNSASTVYSINSYSSDDGSFMFSYDLNNENFRNLRFEFKASSGIFKIEKIVINEKEKTLNYMLIPSDIVFRAEDIIYGSTTVSDRVEYLKDCIKIIRSSYKNFIFGRRRRGL